jgi:hypothetical protein
MDAKNKRAYEWEKRQIAKGRCSKCSKPRVTAIYCRMHADAHNASALKAYYNLSGLEISYRQLRTRRRAALRRMKERNARREATNGTLPE